MIIPGLKFHIDEGAKHRLYSFIDTYIGAGYQITVLLLFSYPSLKYLFKYKNYLREDVGWILMPCFGFSRGLFLKALTIFTGQVCLFFLNLWNKYVFIQAEHNYGGQIARFKRRNTPLIVDFHGESADEYHFLHPALPETHPKLKSIKNSTTRAVRLADFIIVVSENLKTALEKISSQKINNYFVMPCCVDYERFQRQPLATLSEKYADRILLGYCGGLQKWQNIHSILHIVSELRKKDARIFFLLFTNFPTESIKPELDRLGAGHYAVYSLTGRQIPEYLPLMDAGFLIRDQRLLNQVSSPTKILEYLAAGVPVIATQYAGDIKETVKSGENGLILPDIEISGEQIDRIFQFICNVKNNRATIKTTCQNSVQDRTWSKFSMRLLKKIEELI